MKNFFLGLILISLFSCNKKSNEIIEYNKEGKIISKMYVSNENFLDSAIYYKDGIVNKSYFNKRYSNFFYFKSFTSEGRLISEGNTINKIKEGKWKYYDSNDRMKKIVEFKNICNAEYPNQEWNYESNGKLNISKSSFFSYTFKNSKFEPKVSNELTIKYIPLIKKDGVISVIYFSPDFDDKFCNISEVNKDGLKSSDNGVVFKINIGFENRGEKKFRGYIEEHYFEDTNNKEIVNHKTRRVYVDIPIIVK